jgi:hypothetical protein
MKYEVLITTEVSSRIVIESKTDIDSLPPGYGKATFIERLEEAAIDYNAQNDIAAKDWRDGHFAEKACFQGTTDEKADLNLEEWNEQD